MSNNCNSCGKSSCGCGGCEPARYTCGFNIQADPFDKSTWLFDFCGQIHRVKIPKLYETCTNLSTNFSTSSLIYNSECGQNIITGNQLGGLINLDDLRDVEVPDADSCDLLVFDPGCVACGNECKPKPAMWRKYHIPDAGDCEVELDEEGYYHILIKDDCGCIKECRLPAKPQDEDKIIYLRDSVPDDPDYPWYYGCYNDTINLHLKENVPKWFGKYDLEITINYGIQVILSYKCKNTNFRSLLVPVMEGGIADPANDSSVMQGPSAWIDGPDRGLPWGTMSMRSSVTFVVPKGKEASLHHEFRLRTAGSFPGYVSNPLDGRRIPDSVVSTPNQIEWTGSRLNALQAIIKPTSGGFDKNPVRDPIRNQLDPAVDSYANIGA